MGKNYFDDDERHAHKRHKPKHARNIPGRGMKIINSYDIEDDEDDDPFQDESTVSDQIFIQHIKEDTK